MKVPSHATSRPNHIVCPTCERGELRAQGTELAHCEACGCAVEDILLRTLEHIASLADALGKHPCECGHPEMRRLPDGVFHCPACSSEVIWPVSVSKLLVPWSTEP